MISPYVLAVVAAGILAGVGLNLRRRSLVALGVILFVGVLVLYTKAALA
jgi:hypothetical protein